MNKIHINLRHFREDGMFIHVVYIRFIRVQIVISNDIATLYIFSYLSL